MDTRSLSNWMKFIRFHPDRAERFMDCFWESQLDSKMRVVETAQTRRYNSIYVFGGWYGILPRIMLDLDMANYVYSIDKDPDCEWVINDLDKDRDRPVIAITECASHFEYSEHENSETMLVINTSTEHMNQFTYNKWWNQIPTGADYIIQGNNYYDLDEHIRCADDIHHFRRINNCELCDGATSWPCEGTNGTYNRFMAWGRNAR